MSTEKSPLVIQETRPRTGLREFLRAHLPKALLYCTVFYLAFAIMPPFSLSNHPQSSHDSYQDPLSSHGYCNEKPSIPYDGPSEFVFDSTTFPRLSIAQHTNFINFLGGNAQVIYDDQIEKTVVKFDIKLSSPQLQEAIWVEAKEDDDLYSIQIKSEKVNVDEACARLDLTVRVPNKEALKELSLRLYNMDINLDKDLVFEAGLSVHAANGEIRFDQGISAGKTTFSLANGGIVGQFNALLGSELHTSTANGHTDIVVRQIKQEENKPVFIKSSMSNGHIRMHLPVSFESNFKLTNAVGSKRVQSSESNKIHYLSRRWGLVSGYFGDHSQVENVVELSGANGAITLLYQDTA